MAHRCDECPKGQSTMFCSTCGQILDPSTLKTLRFEPRFLGEASCNPKMEQFWATGDPSVFD